MANSYIHIDKSCFEEMKLTPTAAVIYSLIAGYCNHGRTFDMKIEDIACYVNMSEHGVRKTLDRLCCGGYIVKERRQFNLILKTSDEWKSTDKNVTKCRTRTSQSDGQDSHKVTRRKEQSDEQDSHKVTNTHYIINNYNKPNNIGGEDPLYGILVEIFCEFYRVVFKKEYKKNNLTFTTAAINVLDNLKMSMVQDGYVADPDTFRLYTEQWMKKAYTNSEDFHRKRWSIEFINSQFNYLDNVVNNPTNGNRDTHNQPTEISDDYIAEQYSKIARSRAARAAGEAGSGASGTGTA